MSVGAELYVLVLVLDLALIAMTASLLLRGRRWAHAGPRLAIALWQACGLSLLLALVAVLTVTLLPVEEARANLSVTSCLALLGHRLTGAHVLTPTVLLPLAAAAVLARVVVVTGRRAQRASRMRREQREGLDLLDAVARADAHVLDAARPLAYSVAGDGGRVVVTSGAMALLRDEEFAAVVAHERAHLRGRHHLVLLGAWVAHDLMPDSLWARRAHGEVAELLELAADDQAVRRTGAAPVARAIAALSGDPARPAVEARVRRLVGPRPQLPTLTRLTITALAAVLVALPASAVVAPVAFAHVAHAQT